MPEDDLQIVARKICEKRGMQFVKQEGEGTFKQTFKVLTADNQPVALKLYKAESFTRRDEREINAMLRCRHPSIAQLLEVVPFRQNGKQRVWILEEFLPGGTLADKGRIGVEECLKMGRQLIDAVSHIAELSLVHRDIKPANIMFRGDGTPVITDFGIVRDLSDSSITPTWAARGPGTPFFASPEQLNNQKELTDWRSDQFALGVSVAFSLFGDHPYRLDGLSDDEVVDRVSRRQPPCDSFLAAAKGAIPTLARMVSPWPVDRYRRPKLLSQAWGAAEG